MRLFAPGFALHIEALATGFGGWMVERMGHAPDTELESADSSDLELAAGDRLDDPPMEEASREEVADGLDQGDQEGMGTQVEEED